MQVTIAFISIFSAIIVFFADELSAYVKAIVAKPFVFLGFSLFLASTFVLMFDHTFVWIVVTIWIGLLRVLQWLTQHLWLPYGRAWVAEWMILMFLTTSPIGTVLLIAKIKKLNKKKIKALMHRGYMIGAVLGVISLLIYGISPSIGYLR